jgi:hypothetical protein
MLPDVSGNCRVVETSEKANPVIQRHSPQEGIYQHRLYENLKSYITEKLIGNFNFEALL